MCETLKKQKYRVICNCTNQCQRKVKHLLKSVEVYEMKNNVETRLLCCCVLAIWGTVLRSVGSMFCISSLAFCHCLKHPCFCGSQICKIIFWYCLTKIGFSPDVCQFIISAASKMFCNFKSKKKSFFFKLKYLISYIYSFKL